MLGHSRYKKTKKDSVNFDSVPLIYVSFRFHFRTHASISAIKLSISCTAQCSTIVIGFGTHGYAWSVAFSTPPAPLRQPSPLRPATARKHSPHTNPFAQPKPHPRDVPSGPFPSLISKAASLGKYRCLLIELRLDHQQTFFADRATSRFQKHKVAAESQLRPAVCILLPGSLSILHFSGPAIDIQK